MAKKPPRPSVSGSGAARGREPVTLDLKATTVQSGSAEPAEPDMRGRSDTAASATAGPAAPEARAADSAAPEAQAREEALTSADDKSRPAGDPPAVNSELAFSSEPLVGSDEGKAFQDAPSLAAADPAGDRVGAASDDRPARQGLGLATAALAGALAGAGAGILAEQWLRPSREARVAQLEERFGALPAANAADARLTQIERTQAALAERVQAAQAAAEASARRLDEIANRPSPAPSAATATVPDEVATRLAAIEERLRSDAQGSTQAREMLERRLEEQARQLAALGTQIAEEAQRLTAVTTQAREHGERLASLGPQLGEQNQRLEALSRQVAERGPEGVAALRVVAANQIVDALRDGAGFAEALAAMRRLRAEPAQLAALEPFAASGAPTAGALLQEFRPIGERLTSEARGPARTWSERLSRMLEGVVTVRPLAEVGSTSVESLVARIENALNRGDLRDAAAAWDALPEPARLASEGWGNRLKARLAAQDAARTMSNRALAALDASTR